MGLEGQDKTEQPTGRRLSKARAEGQVARSGDLNSAITLTSAMILLLWVGPSTLSQLFGLAQHLFSHLSTKPITQGEFIGMLTHVLTMCVYLVMPFMLGVMVVGVLSNLMQVQPLLTTKPLMPQLTRLNPISGVKRFISRRSLMEFAKSILKTIIVGACGYIIINNHIPQLLTLHSADVYSAWGKIMSVIVEMSIWTCIILVVLGILDYFYQKWEHIRGLRMTKQEVKEENKEDMMDPMIKGKIRQMGQQFTKRKQLSAVPKADVVVTNPTHFAVAIQYDPDIAPAPRVIAKGEDEFALQIREVAKAHNVPIVENKPLARTLYAMVEVERMIPPELFLAVAEVLAYVFHKNKGRGLRNRSKLGDFKNIRRPNQ